MSSTEQPPNPALNPPKYIYKVVPAADWKDTFEATGKFCGSALDQKDGFIHISDGSTTARTIELYFKSQPDILLITLDVSQMLPTGNLKWDWAASRSAFFPHWYDLENGIQKQHIKSVQPIKYDAETDTHIVPQLE